MFSLLLDGEVTPLSHKAIQKKKQSELVISGLETSWFLQQCPLTRALAVFSVTVPSTKLAAAVPPLAALATALARSGFQSWGVAFRDWIQ